MTCRMVLFLTSFAFLSSCALWTSGVESKGLGIQLHDAQRQFVKGAKVELIDVQGNKHRAKLNKDKSAYFFDQHFTSGSLHLSHSKYEKVVYTLENLINKKVGNSIKLFLKTEDQAFYTFTGIRYPYIPIPDGLAIMRNPASLGDDEKDKANLIQKLLKIGLVNDTDFSRLAAENAGLTGSNITLQADILRIPENLEEDQRKQILPALKQSDGRAFSGTLVGYYYLLSPQLKVKLRRVEDRPKITKLLSDLNLEIVSDDQENGILDLRFWTLSTEKMLGVIDALNEESLFYYINPNIKEIYKKEQ